MNFTVSLDFSPMLNKSRVPFGRFIVPTYIGNITKLTNYKRLLILVKSLKCSGEKILGDQEIVTHKSVSFQGLERQRKALINHPSPTPPSPPVNV
jgi:hypothetical protein